MTVVILIALIGLGLFGVGVLVGQRFPAEDAAKAAGHWHDRYMAEYDKRRKAERREEAERHERRKAQEERDWLARKLRRQEQRETREAW